MEFREWLLNEYKFIFENSAICEHCKTTLLPIDITINSNHIYRIGQHLECSCHKSQIWCNSIRDENLLIQFFDGKMDRYYSGFCNDTFCPYCEKDFVPLKNGVPSVFDPSQRSDRYGCRTCIDNQNVQIQDRAPEGANSTRHLIEWYRRHRKKLEDLIAK